MLPSMEQFTVGGAGSVRGYRENRLIADTGFVASVEARIPVYSGGKDGLSLQLAPFLDYGRAGNRSANGPTRQEIASAGLGLLGRLHERVEFRFYYGHAFQEFPGDENDLQDKGFSLQLSARLL
jgi:hemolysin activation/secretion protein